MRIVKSSEKKITIFLFPFFILFVKKIAVIMPSDTAMNDVLFMEYNIKQYKKIIIIKRAFLCSKKQNGSKQDHMYEEFEAVSLLLDILNIEFPSR